MHFRDFNKNCVKKKLTGQRNLKKCLLSVIDLILHPSQLPLFIFEFLLHNVVVVTVLVVAVVETGKENVRNARAIKKTRRKCAKARIKILLRCCYLLREWNEDVDQNFTWFQNCFSVTCKKILVQLDFPGFSL